MPALSLPFASWAFQVSESLVHILSRSIPHSVVGALTHSLTHSPLTDYYCYYCFKYEVSVALSVPLHMTSHTRNIGRCTALTAHHRGLQVNSTTACITQVTPRRKTHSGLLTPYPPPGWYSTYYSMYYESDKDLHVKMVRKKAINFEDPGDFAAPE